MGAVGSLQQEPYLGDQCLKWLRKRLGGGGGSRSSWILGKVDVFSYGLDPGNSPAGCDGSYCHTLPVGVTWQEQTLRRAWQLLVSDVKDANLDGLKRLSTLSRAWVWVSLLMPFPCGVRNRDTRERRCWRRSPTPWWRSLCICINKPGSGPLFPSKSHGVCPPRLCVEKISSVVSFFSFFLPRVAGCLAGLAVTWSSDLLKADFPGPNPRELDTIYGNYWFSSHWYWTSWEIKN